MKSRRWPGKVEDKLGDSGEKKTRTDGEKLETLPKILFVIGLESSSPSLEFSLEGHRPRGRSGRGKVGAGFTREDREGKGPLVKNGEGSGEERSRRKGKLSKGEEQEE